jgi:hypothetical protein
MSPACAARLTSVIRQCAARQAAYSYHSSRNASLDAAVSHENALSRVLALARFASHATHLWQAMQEETGSGH